MSPIAPDQITPPVAIVGVPPIESYHATMARGRATYDTTIYILVSAALDRTGQEALASYADPTGPRSVISAIYGDRTLGGVAEDCLVRSFRPLGVEEVGQIGYYGGSFELRIITAGS
ncbi:hypothetical protein [Actinomadura sp. NEAU-AAG7]|uniref:hypothetical protein n=1 Tax=Actinomadura sp. NEAU-AAG7 TaxID=2839640 RepID=UPI001BE45BBF|nr:hypothetical protein [Actinomadura sp. NEAU-AAG7]MBT2213462.1 hypothetical protein [Actinomadura sp. NEAU-AAG7]